MRLQNWAALGFATAIAAACGGSVSLGDLGSGSGLDGGGADGAPTECATKEACGPAPRSTPIQCPDGSVGGNTGRCLKTASSCAWEQRECPPIVCFDSSGKLNPTLKSCASPADCIVVTHQLNCCGSQQAAGVNVASKEAAEKCGLDREPTFPQCGCPVGPTTADDGSTDTGFSGIAPAVTCNAAKQCETSFKGETCGAVRCNPGATCCSGIPLKTPECFDNGGCPMSRRDRKKDITYLSEVDRERLTDELLRFPLATYRYKSEPAAEREHLGFIIDDVAPSAAVQQSGERVDMYGYQTMAVAALQVQARELATLRREIDELKASCRR